MLLSDITVLFHMYIALECNVLWPELFLFSTVTNINVLVYYINTN